MFDKFKEYFMDMVLKRYAPLGIGVGFAALCTFLAAHAGMLEQWGVTYGIWPLNWPTPPTGPVLVIELDTLKASVIVAIPMIITVLARAGEHHIIGPNPKDKLPAAPPAPTQEAAQ
jgi:hypothetical protein